MSQIEMSIPLHSTWSTSMPRVRSLSTLGLDIFGSFFLLNLSWNLIFTRLCKEGCVDCLLSDATNTFIDFRKVVFPTKGFPHRNTRPELGLAFAMRFIRSHSLSFLLFSNSECTYRASPECSNSVKSKSICSNWRFSNNKSIMVPRTL
ncbi:hypothetical protein M758_5G017200 [Ceratodon purpureus]|nr:hypothetical protein M758_5G017200 [Ceratodon purpureus]